MIIPWILYIIMLGLLVVAHTTSSWVLLGLVALMAMSVLSMAIRLDYIQVVSKPEDLQTWTLRALNNAVYELTDGRYGDHTRIYVEGMDAYHPINGAFLAQIGGAPVVVLQPTKEPHA